MVENQYALFQGTEPLCLNEILDALVRRGIVRIDGNSPVPKRFHTSSSIGHEGLKSQLTNTRTENLTDLASRVGSLLEIDLSPLIASKRRVRLGDVLSSYERSKKGGS